MHFLGIDLGVTGAIGLLNEKGAYCGVWNMPRKGEYVDVTYLFQLLKAIRTAVETQDLHVGFLTTVEAPQWRKGQSRQEQILVNCGIVHAALTLAGFQYNLAQPRAWKAAFDLIMPKSTYTARKKASLRYARKRWPEAPLAREGDHGRAEALLLALYGHQSLNTAKAALQEQEAAASAASAVATPAMFDKDHLGVF